ncbi:MAG TPA: deoxyribonuclease IV [Bacilli bacterium]|nr:deoxyribonuclease IV [Bacilli bacterium]
MKIGSHVSNSGSEMLLKAAQEALSYQANCLMIYLGAPQNSYRKPVSDFKIKEARELLAENNIKMTDIIVHAPYITNLAQPDDPKRRFAIDFIVKEIIMMDQIGAKILVVHPGADVGQGLEIGLEKIILSLEEILRKTPTSQTMLALETMAGKGTECCYKFEHLQKIITTIKSPRLKVCLDTCHIHDAGYDIINAYDQTIKEFSDTIGLDRLAVIHLNDSQNDRGARKDRHANIGFGKIGFTTLAKFAHDERFKDIFKILETPYVSEGKKEYPPYKHEIFMLRQGIFNPDLLGKIKED